LLKKSGLEMTAWSHLPNATHIDQVLADLKSHPDEFAVAWDAVSWNTAWSAARDAGRGASGLAAYDAAWDAARAAGRNAAWDMARAAAWDAAWDAAWAAARAAARTAITALIAWDHSVNYLDMTYEELGVWYQLNEDPACVLLLPYLKAKELISQKIEA
jgi:hypothetical protein